MDMINYDYMDSLDKFEETLPRKYDLYSVLADEPVSNEAYQHAGNAFSSWRT